MVSIASSAVARASRVRRDGKGLAGMNGWVNLYLGTNALNAGDTPPVIGALSPSAHLVEQDPETAVGAHFHQCDQFQLAVSGGGTLAGRPIETLSLHYTNAGTPYGPILSGASGLSYFVLRNGFDPGAKTVAENRDLLKSMNRVPREAASAPFAISGAEVLVMLPAPATTDMIAPAADGLGARIHRLPPGQRGTGPDPSLGRGQYWINTAGKLIVDDQILPPMSCVFVHPDDPPLFFKAGETGLELVMMQFPKRDEPRKRQVMH